MGGISLIVFSVRLVPFRRDVRAHTLQAGHLVEIRQIDLLTHMTDHLVHQQDHWGAVFFRKLKAATVRSKAWATEDGLSAMIGWSPCVPQRACITSPCDGLVGCPVLGPSRCTSTTTTGISVIAEYPMCSYSGVPCPLVAVIDFAPGRCPMQAARLAISSSI